MDVNLLLAVASVILMLVLTGFFVWAVRHQASVDPVEEEVRGVALLRQHYAAGATLEQPTPYWVSPIPASPDPLEIAANLDKKIVLSGATLFAVFLLTGVYFAMSVGAVGSNPRDRGAEHQLKQRVVRGGAIYANLCYDCHGERGQGISGAGLPLNIDANRHSTLAADPAKLAERETALRLVIERGRAKPLGQLSMPQLARYEGGPLGPEAVNQVLAFIMHAAPAQWDDLAHIRLAAGLQEKPQTPEAPRAPTGAEGGRVLIRQNTQQSCTTCHSFTAGQASTLPTAPNLAEFGTKGPVTAELQRLKASDPQWLQKWIANSPGIKPGTAMPPFSDKNGGRLTDQEINSIVEYLNLLGTGREPK